MLTRTQKSPYSVKNGIFVTTLNHLTPTKIHGVNFFSGCLWVAFFISMPRSAQFSLRAFQGAAIENSRCDCLCGLIIPDGLCQSEYLIGAIINVAFDNALDTDNTSWGYTCFAETTA